MTKHRILFLIFGLGLLAFSSFSYAQPAGIDSSDKITARLTSLEAQLEKVETHQKEILARQEQILAELDRLRVWVHRR